MAGGGGDSEYEVNINLTALLDVLTNILFFLMFGMAAQQSVIELDTKIDLPSSSAELPPKDAIKVTVGQKQLLLDKEVIMPIENFKIGGKDGKGDGRIEPLFSRLQGMRNKKVASAAPNDDSDVLFILCDKGAPYSLLRRVMMTGAEAGFPKFRMAVLME